MRRRHAALLTIPAAGLVLALGVASAAPSGTEATAAIEHSTLEGPATIVAAGPHGSSTKLPPLPHVTAQAYVVYDATDRKVLAAHDAHQTRAIASLTKMMTALVVLERDRPNDEVAITQDAVDTNDGSALAMTAGQRYPVHVLFTAMLVHSANDAAEAFADHTGLTTFVAAMNAKARALGMTHTHFTSPHGLDSVPGNRSTAADVLVLARAAMAQPAFRTAVATRSYRFVRPDGTSTTYPNRNDLLGTFRGVDGVKTGFTADAGECLVTHLHLPNGDDDYVVDLGSSSEATRDSDSRALLTWAESTRVRVVAVSHTAAPPVSVPTADNGGTLTLRIPADLAATVLIGQRLTVTADVPDVVSGPVSAGKRIGTLELRVADTVVASEPLLATRAIAAQSTAARAATLARRVRTAWSVGFHSLT